MHGVAPDQSAMAPLALLRAARIYEADMRRAADAPLDTDTVSPPGARNALA